MDQVDLGSGALPRAGLLAAAAAAVVLLPALAASGSVALAWFVPVMDALSVLAFAVVAYLALLDAGLREARRSLPVAVIGIAMAPLWLAHLLVFPADIPALRGEIANDLTSWIYMLANIALPAMLATTLALPTGSWRGRRDQSCAVALGLLIAAVLLALATILATSPLTSAQGNGFTPLTRWVGAASTILPLLGLLLLLRGHRGDARVTGGVAAALILATAASAALVPLRARYTPLWYSTHLLQLAASVALLAGQLHLYRITFLGERLRVRQLGALLEAARVLTSALGRDEVLAAAGRTYMEVLTAGGSRIIYRAVALTVEGNRLRLHGLSGVDSPAAPVDLPTAHHPAAVAAIASGKAAWCRKSDLDSQLRAVATGETQVCAPVHVGGQVVALLAATADGAPFEDSELELAQGVADLAGLALGNAGHIRLLADEADRLLALERVKTNFLRLASHELRGPLAIFGGYVSMMLDGTMGPLAPAQLAPLKVLATKAREMSALVTQLTDAARLEDSELALETSSFDLREPVQEVVEARRNLLPAGLAVILDAPEVPVEVTADRAKVVTMTLNLVDNAVKYSPGGGEVVVRVGLEGETAVVEVRDQGIGISPEDLPRLFTRFGRIVTPGTAGIPGTGLGLYLTRELARMHGGDVEVSSSDVGGSTFRLTLPASGPQGTAPRQPDAIPIPSEARRP